ncbi:hypothetical protein PMAYCL1PPCAC_27449, partial [Pristionchus mayeri]
RLNVVDTQEVKRHTDLPASPSLESLPWPPLTRILSSLYTDGECFDLANLSMVSTHFRVRVYEFMKRANNRPGIDRVDLFNSIDGGIRVRIVLFPSNLHFYDISGLDWSRFERRGSSFEPKLGVTLNGPEDPIFEQISKLLSVPIKHV